MSFWKTFGFHTVSAIDNILDGGEYTLEQLLDEDEILQETKSLNKKLLDFLTEPETLTKLITYITVKPETEEDQKKLFKFPFLACEILASEVWTICDAIFQHPGLLDMLFAYFEKEPPLDNILSSYTSRVASILLQKKVGDMISYLKNKPNIIDSILKHMANASVMDFLLKLISCEDMTGGTGVLEWLCTTPLISTIIQKFNPSQSRDVHENAAQTLVDIILVSSHSASSPLIAQLESETTMKQLFSFIFPTNASTEPVSSPLNTESALSQALSVLTTLVRRHCADTYHAAAHSSLMMDQSPTIVDGKQELDAVNTAALQALPTPLQFVVTYLPHFVDRLKTNTNKITLTVGEMEPLGFTRLKIVEFVATLAKSNYSIVEDGLMKTGAIKICVELFFRHPWNNFLHSLVEVMVRGIFEGANEDLKVHVIKDCEFVEKILATVKKNDEICSQPKGMRLGNMGHITALSQLLGEFTHLPTTPNPATSEAINSQNTSVSIVTGSAVEKLLSEKSDWVTYAKSVMDSRPPASPQHFGDLGEEYPDEEGQGMELGKHYGFDTQYGTHEDPFLITEDQEDEEDSEEDSDDSGENIVIARRETEDEEIVVTGETNTTTTASINRTEGSITVTATAVVANHVEGQTEEAAKNSNMQENKMEVTESVNNTTNNNTNTTINNNNNHNEEHNTTNNDNNMHNTNDVNHVGQQNHHVNNTTTNVTTEHNNVTNDTSSNSNNNNSNVHNVVENQSHTETVATKDEAPKAAVPIDSISEVKAGPEN